MNGMTNSAKTTGSPHRTERASRHPSAQEPNGAHNHDARNHVRARSGPVERSLNCVPLSQCRELESYEWNLEQYEPEENALEHPTEALGRWIGDQRAHDRKWLAQEGEI